MTTGGARRSERRDQVAVDRPVCTPFLISSAFEYDAELNAFFRSSAMVVAVRNTQIGYARDLTGFLSFLWSGRRRLSWREAQEADHVAYLHWRRFDPLGPRVDGRTRDRAVAAVSRFHRRQVRSGRRSSGSGGVVPEAARRGDARLHPRRAPTNYAPHRKRPPRAPTSLPRPDAPLTQPTRRTIMTADPADADQPVADYTAGLPTKRMAAAVLFFDDTDRLLLVEPAYTKTHWELPGGCVEADESPPRRRRPRDPGGARAHRRAWSATRHRLGATTPWPHRRPHDRV